MKQIVSFLLIVLFSFQLVPLQSWRKMMNVVSMAEEIKDDHNPIKHKKFPDPMISFCSGYNNIAFLVCSDVFSLEATVHIPMQHVAEIESPPPNFIA